MPEISAHASWDFPRGPAAARILLAVGAERGLSSAACLAGTGLDPHHLDDASVTVKAGQKSADFIAKTFKIGARNDVRVYAAVDGQGTRATLTVVP